MAAANPQMLIRIAANLAQLKQNLAEGRNQIEIVTAAAAKMATSLDGSKLEQKAHNITAAIHAIGGATNLTDAEARRHLRTLDDWIEKGNRMGKEIPADILKTRDALKQIDDTARSGAGSGTNLLGTLTKIGGAVGIAFSIGAVKNFIGSVFEAGGKINDLSSQLGISTDAVQGFKYAAEQSGSSLDTVGRAITKMNDNLASGEKGTINALKQAGLNFNAIRAMEPEKAFLAISEAVKKIEDPMIQTDIALKLFGKSGAELLPAIKAGFTETSDSAAKMSKETIESLDKAGDAWQTLADRVTIITGSLIASTMDVTTKVTSSWKNFVMFAENAVKFGVGAAVAMADAQVKAESASKLLTDAQKENIKWLVQMKNPVDMIAPLFGAASDAARLYALSLMKVVPPLKDNTNGHKDHGAAIEKVIALTSEQIQVNNLLVKAKQHEKSNVDFAAAAWKAWETAASTALKNIEAHSAPLLLVTRNLSGIVPMVNAAGGGNMAGYTPPPEAKAGFFKTAFGTSAEFGQQMAGTIMGAIKGGGNPISAAAGMVGSKLGAGIAGSLTKEGGKLFQSALGGVLNSALPFVGSLVGPLVGALWGKLFGTAGRDAVKDFAATFKGGFDGPEGLHEALNTLGAEGERLWIKLTQGTGRNNPAQAKATIDEITAALARQKAKTDELAAAATASAAQQQGALDAIAEKYDGIIGKLKGELGSFSASLQAEADAPEFDDMGNRIYGVVELQQMARKAQIEAQIEAAEITKNAEMQAKQEEFAAILDSGKDVDQRLRDMFGKPFEMGRPMWPGLPGGAPLPSGDWGNAGGGITPPGTVPQRGGGSGGGDMLVPITLVTPDGDVLLKQVVKAGKRRGWM